MVNITGPQYIAYMWIMTAVCLVFVLLRLQIRRRIKGGLRISDWLVVAAWFAFLYQDITDTYTLTKGLYVGKIDAYAKEFGPEHGLATYEETVVVLKLLYVELAFYYTEMYFVKGAMIAFYYELFPKSMPRLRIALHIVAVFTFISWLSSVLVKLFFCLPVKVNYTPGPDFCDAISSFRSNLYEWVLHVATDLCIYVLPLFLLKTLRLPGRQKIAVGATFAVGLVCIVWANLFQISVLLNAPTAVSWFCGATEQWWALVVVCCPTFRALLNKKDFRSAWKYIRGDQDSMDNSYDLSHGISTGGTAVAGTMTASRRMSMHKNGTTAVTCNVEGGWDLGASENMKMGEITETIEITREVRRVASTDSSLHKELEVSVVRTKVQSTSSLGEDNNTTNARDIDQGGKPASVNSACKPSVQPFDFV